MTISGTAMLNQLLTASNSLADVDGLSTIAYQWLADGSSISGATTSTLTLTEAQVGKAITVQASYIDLQGAAESVTSSATAPISVPTAVPVVTITAGITPVEGAAGGFIVTLDSPAPAGGLTINYSLSGSATLNTDYTVTAGANISSVTNGSFTIAEGQTTASLTINAAGNDGYDPNETVDISLQTGSGYSFVGNVSGFESKVDITTGLWSVWVSSGDFNGDGKLDLAVSNWGSNTVSVLLRNAENTGFDPKVDFATGSNPLPVSIGDVNGDGKLDLVVTNRGSNTVSVLLRNADNTGFDPKVDFATGAGPVSVNICDVNGDGKLDFVVANEVSGTVSVFLNNTVLNASLIITDNTPSNIAPTLTSFDSSVATGDEDSQILISFDNLIAHGDEADVDGTVTAFDIKAVSSGSLKIGTSADTAMAWDASSNTTIDATHQAYWTPASNANGTLNAFTVVALDNSGLESEAPVQATVAVTPVNDAPTGSVYITGTCGQGETLTATNDIDDVDGVGTITYQWLADGQVINGATGDTFTLGQAEVGKIITVCAKYDDHSGNTETLIDNTDVPPVSNINDIVLGAVDIISNAIQNQTLTAHNTLTDVDGLGVISYQWLADNVDIIGAVGETLLLTQAQVGKAISVRASYVDGFGTYESVTSAQTNPVINVNDLPIGGVNITGTLAQYEVLTADTSTLADIDGLGALHYQWLADGIEIVGATDSTFALTQAQVGKAISVTVSYIDGYSTNESVTSTVTSVVVNVNDAPVANTDTLTATEDTPITYTAAQLLGNDTDVDGNALTIASVVSGAGGSVVLNGNGTVTFSPSANFNGSASFTYVANDGSLNSNSTTVTVNVTPVNDLPTGNVLITGTPTVGQTLTESNTLADVDGLDVISYQWLANGSVIAGATNTTYVLTATEVGKTISVTASYVDGAGTAESVTSLATSAVISANTGSQIFYSTKGDDIFNGNTNNDTVSYIYATDEVRVSLAITGPQSTYGAGKDTLIGIEHLIGSNYKDTLTGNALNNSLAGGLGNDTINAGAGNDTLIGGAGSDNLTGGAGADIFWFDTAANATSNKDTITDFVSGTDKLQFSANVLTAAGVTGQLAGNDQRFWSSNKGVAHDSDDRFIYNTATGALSYDSDGTGKAAAVVLEILGSTKHPVLVASDIVLV